MYAQGKILDSPSQACAAVSFIIPAHNEAKYLGATIDAILKAIDETDVLAEIIVVNDDSNDGTGDLAREKGARTIDVKLRNIGAVRNAGAKVASHDWIIFVDADTIVPAKTLEQTIISLSRGDAGGGARVVIDNPENLFWVKRLMYYGVILGWQIIGRWAAGCYMFCSKDLFDSFGGFDEEYFAAEEYFFSRQVAQRGKFRLVPSPVVTSARKLHRYSTPQLARFLLFPLTNLRTMLRSQEGLEILYQDER